MYLTRIEGALPHAKVVTPQNGGLLGLQRLLVPFQFDIAGFSVPVVLRGKAPSAGNVPAPVQSFNVDTGSVMGRVRVSIAVAA